MSSGRKNTGRAVAMRALSAGAVCLGGAAIVLTLGAAGAAVAQGKDLKAVDRVPTVTFDAALLAAQAALADCRKRGATVAVAVVDRSGIPVVMLRDPLAGMHTPETAIRKAWTAVSFRSNTLEFAAETQAGRPSSGIRDLPRVVAIGGGVLIEAGGSIVGAIGVSGAPGGDADDLCARAGIAAIRDDIDF
jgi:uncharacterized protein GlcG (DUF336 family)